MYHELAFNLRLSHPISRLPETLQKAREELAEEVQISRFVALHHQIHIFFDGLPLLRKTLLEVLTALHWETCRKPWHFPMEILRFLPISIVKVMQRLAKYPGKSRHEPLRTSPG